MLVDFFNKTIIIRRLKTTGTGKRNLSATATVDGTYQNIDQDESASIEGVSGKTYKGWFEINTDIQAGDVLTDQSTGKQFRVMSIEKKADNYGLETDHLEVIMQYNAN